MNKKSQESKPFNETGRSYTILTKWEAEVGRALKGQKRFTPRQLRCRIRQLERLITNPDYTVGMVHLATVIMAALEELLAAANNDDEEAP